MYSIQYNSVMNEFCICYYGECSEMAMLQVPDWFQELSFCVQTLTHMLNDGLTTLTFHSLQTCHLIIVKDQVFLLLIQLVPLLVWCVRFTVGF